MSTSSLPPNFDFFTQNFTLLAPDGSEFTTNMGDIDYLRQYGVRIAVNWGTQIGASVILLLVLFLLTKREKRKSSIFILNTLCLVLNTIRSILQCVWLTSNWWHPYALVSGDYSRITPADRANTVVSNTILLILTIMIMVSLSLQVWVVCVTAKPMQRLLIMGATTLIALVAVGYRFAITVLSNIQTMRNDDMTRYTHYVTNMHVTFAIAVWVYACVFTFKLGHALIQRRRLRMSQFGPMQIIFIMGCQTMIVPAIFTSLRLDDRVPELTSQSTTIICIFMPLSAIWAGVVSSDANIGSRGADAHQRLFKDQFYRSPSVNTNDNRFSEKGSTVTASTYNGSTKDPESPRTARHASQRNNSIDHAIYVNRDWTVEADEASCQT